MADGEAAPATAKKSDLGVRTLSAIVMLLVAGTALWLGNPFWALFVLVVCAACFGEFARLVWAATDKSLFRYPALILGAAYIGGAGAILASRRDWMGQISQPLDNPPALLTMLPVLALVGTVICTDVGAYFAGRSIGGPKIAPRISPSKTWAGLIGGMTAASLWAVAMLYLENSLWDYAIELPTQHVLLLAASGALLAVVAQTGDFFESWLKRKAGVKDSSNLIPGHGGVFDRVDGLLPVTIASLIAPFPLGGWYV
ncbi:phosphatidate cytidylyltransferase [Alteraurantiacibacter aquimixticola]|uniref:Phosphatidate cytidylyltransferase n=1 Tax=Alteraurantiacibacter aquimixticola TaxID=2489173 RepID=A0A4T3F527_9SPHN|nr:phosphatidate cytidylyltransferase [Alteraurantiacibacter aquimixticola]TIX51941.1 phosphatidate cytidylyltransferase [Alteraurantiacibacter aquimixticola]